MKQAFLYLTCSLLCVNVANAQISGEKLYLPYANPPKVYAEGGREMKFAWAGGANNPQLAIADLNQDGIKDLVIFDGGPNTGYGYVMTFLNKSDTPGKPHYVHAPQYQAAFPSINGYLKLEDYNRDQVPDLIYRGFSGVTPLKGYYKDSMLQFNTNTKFAGKTGLYYMTGGSGLVNVYVAPLDMPAMGDVDGDGDLDVVTYDVSGSTMYFYRNCQIEEGMPKDSFPVCVKDGCWGKVAQAYQRKLAFPIDCGHYGETCKNCDASAGKTTHAGNTCTFVDFDYDGDMDMLNANVSFSDIQYLINGKKESSHAIDTIIGEDTLWSSNGKTLYMPQMPAAYWLDLDNNGSRDLAFCPYIPNSENYKCIVYYKNTGTNSHPNFVYQSDTLFMEDMIDAGTGSAPVLYDYNKDGKLDMFLGSQGYYQASNGTFRARIQYYENTTPAGQPGAVQQSFTLKSRDFLGLGSANIQGSSLAMGDLDGDGKDDLVIGQQDGTILYFKNNAATSAAQPIWQSPVTLNDQFGTMDVGDYSSPCIYDINKDGKKDLIVGCQNGRLFYYKNLGSNIFNRITDTLGGLFLMEDGVSYTYLSPYIGRVDNTTKDYLMIGTGNGIIYRYDISGATYTRIDSFYSGVNVRFHAKPSFGDIDGDGKYEMAVGSSLGGVVLYEQYFNVGIDDKELASGHIKIYPNPATRTITVDWLSNFSSGDVYISLISVTGQKLYQGTVPGSDGSTQIDVSGLPSGTYYCIVRSAENQASSPVSIIR